MSGGQVLGAADAGPRVQVFSKNKRKLLSGLGAGPHPLPLLPWGLVPAKCRGSSPGASAKICTGRSGECRESLRFTAYGDGWLRELCPGVGALLTFFLRPCWTLNPLSQGSQRRDSVSGAHSVPAALSACTWEQPACWRSGETLLLRFLLGPM